MSAPTYNPYNPTTNQVAQPNQIAAPTQAQTATVPGPIPFRIAAKELEQEGNTYSNVSLTATAAGTFSSPIPTEGYISAAELDVVASGGVNGSVTVAAAEDAPFSAIQSLILSDARGTQLHTLNGFTWYLLQRYHGGSQFAMESDTQSFSNVSTGAAGTGNFKMSAKVPIEYAPDGRGCLPNSNDAAAYKVLVKFAQSAQLFTTPPGTPPTLSGTIRLLGRIIPPPADVYGRPQVQTPPIYESYIVSESESPTGSPKAGANSYYLVKKGNVYSMVAMIFRDNSGSRAGSVTSGFYPTTVGLKVDTFQKVINLNVNALNKRVYEKTGLVVPNGCVIFLFNKKVLGGLNTLVDDLLPTLASTSIRFDWNATSAGGSVEFFHVDIVSPDGGLAVTQSSGDE